MTLSLEEMKAAGIAVKPLEWVERPWAARQWAASSVAGDYFAGESDGKFYWNKLMEPGNGVASIKEAQAAAQADYEQRIRSALRRSHSETPL